MPTIRLHFLRWLWFLVSVGIPAGIAQPFLVSTNGDLTWKGQPFRGIGVNGYDLFARTLSDPSSTNALDAYFGPLARRGIPFVRFAACGYWPADWKRLEADPQAEDARMDAVVAAARRHGVGLVPSLFWFQPTLPDLCGEPVSAWGDPSSGTRRRMAEHTRRFVRRWSGEPTIRAWEFGNEHNLPADLPNAAEHRPPVVPSLGTPDVRSAQDEITHAAVRSAFRAFAEVVRENDPSGRAILSGHAFPRASAWHQIHRKSWGKDSYDQFLEVFRDDHPEPADILGGRLYEESDLTRIPDAMKVSRRLKKPLFIGEFGVPGPATEAALRRFDGMLDAMEAAQVPVAALWVYDFPGQATDWSVRTDNDRAPFLERIAERNRRWLESGSGRRGDGGR